MKTEHSAGGVVIRKNQSVWEILLIKDMNGSFTFAKGLIEKGETARDAAVREVAEETGVRPLKFIVPLKPVEYMYRKNGLIKKTVDYFLFETAFRGKLKPQKEEGVSEAVWVPLDKAGQVIGYPGSNLPIINSVSIYLSKWT